MGRQYFRQTFRSRIAQQLTLWVFGSLLAIEAAILLPSYLKREQDLLTAQVRLVTTSLETAIAEPASDRSSEADSAKLLALLAQMKSQAMIADYAVFTQEGTSLGPQNALPAANLDTLKSLLTKARLNRIAQTYDTVMYSEQQQPPLYLYIRHSTQDVQAELNGYTARMLGMILLIALVVTVGSMIGIERLVIRPVLALRSDLQVASHNLQHGIRDSPFETNRLDRHDELSEVISTFRLMYGHIWQAIDAHESASLAKRQAQDKADELRENITNLHQNQTQLLQTEKMTGLSQLVAGVAHEINNPISFIHGNLQCLQTYIEDMLSLIQLYEHQYPDPTPAIVTKVEAIDLDFMQHDLPKLITSIQTGSNRVREIVLSLRNFSRLDESEIKPVDIHEGLDNTLMMLNHQLLSTPSGAKINIVREYGKLPRVECYAGLLNQVFMNILANAAEALGADTPHPHRKAESADSPEPLAPAQANPEQTKQITLRTTQPDENWVTISISNNGPAISADTQQHMFEPFFTTKPVGKGTGMGLSISYQIVTVKHRGKLLCLSGPEHATEFIIQIPIKHA